VADTDSFTVLIRDGGLYARLAARQFTGQPSRRDGIAAGDA